MKSINELCGVSFLRLLRTRWRVPALNQKIFALLKERASGASGFATIALLTACFNASAANLVVPSDHDDTEGNDAQTTLFPGDLRYITIYDPVEFISAIPEGGVISGFMYRLDGAETRSPVTMDVEIEVRLSTSPRTEATASLDFADNIGADEKVVLPKQALHLEGSSLSTVIPRPFDLEVPFAEPFIYDPRRGSLAIDVKVFKGSVSRYGLDASGEAVAIGGNLGLDRAFFKVSGAVIQLHVTPVPEPGAIAILALGLSLLIWFTWFDALSKERKLI